MDVVGTAVIVGGSVAYTVSAAYTGRYIGRKAYQEFNPHDYHGVVDTRAGYATCYFCFGFLAAPFIWLLFFIVGLAIVFRSAIGSFIPEVRDERKTAEDKRRRDEITRLEREILKDD